MLDAARLTQQIIEGQSRDSLDDNIVITLALTRLIEIMGEAANHVSEETRARLSTIPWRNIVGMRNRVIHDYGNVNHDILWKTITEHIPILIDILETTLPNESPQTDMDN
jgi:uncharacterized protein with HEPN domain